MKYTDCIKDVFYRYCYNEGDVVIGKCSSTGNYHTTIAARLTPDTSSFWTDGCFSACNYVELASPKEIAWLLACEAKGQHISFNTFNYQIEYEIY